VHVPGKTPAVRNLGWIVTPAFVATFNDEVVPAEFKAPDPITLTSTKEEALGAAVPTSLKSAPNPQFVTACPDTEPVPMLDIVLAPIVAVETILVIVLDPASLNFIVG
jgi:hypothetical protein